MLYALRPTRPTLRLDTRLTGWHTQEQVRQEQRVKEEREKRVAAITEALHFRMRERTPKPYRS